MILGILLVSKGGKWESPLRVVFPDNSEIGEEVLSPNHILSDVRTKLFTSSLVRDKGVQIVSLDDDDDKIFRFACLAVRLFL